MNNHRFHDIPSSDALVGIYAAYYIGEKGNERKDHLNVTFNKRAMNTYNMDAALEAGFGKADSPWVMLADQSAPRETAKGNRAEQHGGHFIAMYHKASRQVMIALPGMEYDYSLKDTLDDAKQLLSGVKEQSAALFQFTKDIEARMQAGDFKGADGQPLSYASDKPVIGSHSMGCTPAQMMAVDGYKTILVEPRPLHDGAIKKLTQNLARNSEGDTLTPEQALARLDANTVNLRAQHCNVWNSVLLPWVKEKRVGLNFSYGDEKPATLLDRFITTHHAAEVLVPSLMNTAETQGAKGFKRDMSMTPDDGPARTVWASQKPAGRSI